MNNLWATSKNAGDRESTYEYAAVMWVDTRQSAPKVWDFQFARSDAYPYSQATFPAPFSKLNTTGVDYGDPRQGGRWIVGWFHTHPSWDNAPLPRVVGKSSGDSDPGNGIPAWVMDYVSDEYDGDYGGPIITPNGARTASGKLEKYGGSGRIN